MTNYDTTFEEDLYRVKKVQELGICPDVRVYRKNSAPQIQGISIPPAVRQISTNRYAPLFTAKSQLSKNAAFAIPLSSDIISIVISTLKGVLENANNIIPIITHKKSRIACNINPSVIPFTYSLVFLPQ